jgi:hypothetical protein
LIIKAHGKYNNFISLAEIIFFPTVYHAVIKENEVTTSLSKVFFFSLNSTIPFFVKRGRAEPSDTSFRIQIDEHGLNGNYPWVSK